jgi:lysophospholipase L1-like esterase
MATTHTAFGQFLNHYRALKRAGQLATTPLILSEGDSWFSTPLYFNLVDWLEADAAQSAFLRLESSGDLATDIFAGASLRKIGQRLKDIEFDVLLISAGGNDFVDEFLRRTFAGKSPMSVAAALTTVRATGRFDQVRVAYQRMIDTALAARPNIRILAHSYDYPQRMGAPAQLTLEQIGLVALLKRSIGDWIQKNVRHVLPTEDEQRAFARGMIDEFHDSVLMPLHNAHPQHFELVDFRGQLTQASDWNDEMHPTGNAFRRLAVPLRAHLRALLPVAKQAGIG